MGCSFFVAVSVLGFLWRGRAEEVRPQITHNVGTALLEWGNPVELTFPVSPKPCQLALGQFSAGSLGLFDSFITIEAPRQHIDDLPIAYRFQRMCVSGYSGVENLLHLLNQSTGKHLIDSAVDLNIEVGPLPMGRSQESVVTRGFLVAVPVGGYRFPRNFSDLQSTEDPLPVRGTNPSRGLGVEGGQPLVDGRAVLIPVEFEAGSNIRVAGWGREETEQQGADVKVGSANNDRQVVSPKDVLDGRVCGIDEFAGREWLGWIEDIQKVMGDASLNLGRGFVGADVHAAINGKGIGRDNLSAQPFSHRDPKAAFARSGRPHDDQDVFQSRSHCFDFRSDSRVSGYRVQVSGSRGQRAGSKNVQRSTLNVQRRTTRFWSPVV